MKPTRNRFVGLAAALSAMAIAAPVSSASAATAAPAFAPVPGVGAGWGGWGTGWGGAGVPFAQGAFALGATVVGPVIITTAPSTFINTNNQVSAGSNFSGGQFGP